MVRPCDLSYDRLLQLFFQHFIIVYQSGNQELLMDNFIQQKLPLLLEQFTLMHLLLDGELESHIFGVNTLDQMQGLLNFPPDLIYALIRHHLRFGQLFIHGHEYGLNATLHGRHVLLVLVFN